VDETMRVTIALLADAANVSREGKLNILGVFDAIYARSFPTTHPQMQLVLRFEAAPTESGATRSVEVRLVAPDGRVLFRVPGALAIQRGEAGEATRIDRLFSLSNVGFDQPGRYAIEVAVDGELAAAVPLRVEAIGAPH
jgi:hypothetical protein